MARLVKNYLTNSVSAIPGCFYSLRVEDEYSYYSSFCSSLNGAVKQARKADFGDYRQADLCLYRVALIATEHTPEKVRPDWDNAVLLDSCPVADVI